MTYAAIAPLVLVVLIRLARADPGPGRALAGRPGRATVRDRARGRRHRGRHRAPGAAPHHGPRRVQLARAGFLGGPGQPHPRPQPPGRRARTAAAVRRRLPRLPGRRRPGAAPGQRAARGGGHRGDLLALPDRPRPGGAAAAGRDRDQRGGLRCQHRCLRAADDARNRPVLPFSAALAGRQLGPWLGDALAARRRAPGRPVLAAADGGGRLAGGARVVGAATRSVSPAR